MQLPPQSLTAEVQLGLVLVLEYRRRAASRREIYDADAFPYVFAILSKRASERARPLAASTSRFLGGEVVTSAASRCSIE